MTLLSHEFVFLAGLAIATLSVLRGPLRMLALCGLSGWYVASYLDGPGLCSTAAFIAAGYVFARLAPTRGRLAVAGIAAIVSAFVVVRRYSFLEAVLQETIGDFVLSTAGLSFLLFKIIHVIVDRAGGRSERLPFGEYVAYCLNFTTFLLGPIQRFDDFSSQWRGETAAIESTFEAHLDAANRVLLGLVKKFVVAEFVFPYALAAGGTGTLAFDEALLATWIFYLYLYLDFSGYCDVMIGVGALMGVRPPENFRMPFLAPNVSEFWLRVHRSLTTWLTDYVFNPLFAALLRTRRLGGRTVTCAAVALMVTMLVSGLWHGTTVSFLVFGLVHGVMLVTHRVFDHWLVRRFGRKRVRAWRESLPWRIPATALTFLCTATTYVFFVLSWSEFAAMVRRFAT